MLLFSVETLETYCSESKHEILCIEMIFGGMVYHQITIEIDRDDIHNMHGH